MKRLVVCALLAAGCGGLPIPTPGATRCADNVYLEVGVGPGVAPEFTCADALSQVRAAEQETGVNLRTDASVIEFMAGDNLAQIGHPTAIGACMGDTIAASARHSNSLIHEALHLADHSHCNWSKKYLPLFERNYVGGSFDDTCAGVHCTSTRAWQDSRGQWFGNAYVCTPL